MTRDTDGVDHHALARAVADLDLVVRRVDQHELVGLVVVAVEDEAALPRRLQLGLQLQQRRGAAGPARPA
jgi:hypothetical protein